jgi:hypothetical protein
MVKAFIESGEYRRRFFGAPSGNQEGQTLLRAFAQEVENSWGRPNRVTLKALANSSPGFVLKPWV